MTDSDPNNQQVSLLMQRAANLQRGGRPDQVAAVLQQVVQIDPMHYQASCALAQIAAVAGHADACLHYAQRAEQSNPKGFEALALLVQAHQLRGETPAAIAALQRAAKVQPDNDKIHFNLGVLGEKHGDLKLATEAYERAVALNPNNHDALGNLALLQLADNDLRKAINSFSALCAARRGTAAMIETSDQLPPLPDTETLSSKFKIKMDHEQLAYLQQLGKLPANTQDLLDALPLVLNDLPDDLPEDEAFNVRHPKHHWKTHWQVLGRYHNRPISVPAITDTDEPLINPNLDVHALESEYHNGSPQMVVVDQFLTPYALSALREFCREATIWHDLRRNYLGAYLTDGFANALTLGIAQQLKQALPGIFGTFPLTQAWGYKYGAALNGIAMHADAAAVNCNFWIAENEANLDAEHGGLLVYRKEAPLDWDFDKFNNDTEAMKAHLGSSLQDPVRIPHKANRIVIFNSNLFHKTDDIRFADEFLSRRYNMTLLFGRRRDVT
ncbi:MAG: tetratricopeptide repeat protein [Woeseiaceae bacterium]